MAIVLLDNKYFKFTLQIIEDFIGEDYDAFIEKGPSKDNNLIKSKEKLLKEIKYDYRRNKKT